MAKNKAITDFGEKIGGAKKDMWKSRGLSYADLNDMNAAEAAIYVKKDNVWPKPDWRFEMDNGTPQALAFWQSEMRRALKPKPVKMSAENNEDAIKRYVRFASDLKDSVMSVETEDEMKSFFEDFFIGRGYLRRTSGRYVVPDDSVAGLIDNKLISISQTSGFNALMADKKCREFGLTEEEKKKRKMAVVRYDDQITFSLNETGRLTIKVKAPAWCFTSVSCYPVKEDYVAGFEPGTWVLLDTDCPQGRLIAGRNYPDRKTAEDALDEYVAGVTKEIKEEKAEKKTAAKKAFSIPYLDELKRTGPDVLGWCHADSGNYLDDLRFRGGEFGNWVGDRERQTDMDLGYEALCDLADMLGLKKESVSLDGTLAIAFGSRGNGGANAARAHYEPMRKVINLTKKKGGGCLAHEWGHALDHFIGEKCGAPAGKLATDLLADRKNTLPDEFKMVMDAIKWHKHYLSADEQMAVQKKNTGIAENNLTSQLKMYSSQLSGEDKNRFAELIRAAINTEIPSDAYTLTSRGAGPVVKEIEGISAFIEAKTHSSAMARQNKMFLAMRISMYRDAKSREGKFDPNLAETTGETDFYRNSQFFDKTFKKEKFGYWASGAEMFARAFDCYVSDKLTEAGRRSDYLTAYSDSFKANDGHDGEVKAYPQGKERQAINERFDALIAKIKELGWLS